MQSTGTYTAGIRRRGRLTAPFFWSSALNGLDRRPPGDDLEKQIEEHRDMSGTRHPFVKCRFATTDYDAFNEDKFGYYLYFRESFLKEKVLISSPGYVWLLTVELINDLALETIGDAVIEHKTVHEEYADTLRKALKKPYRE